MKRKREEQFVDMDECLFTTKNIELYTLGVSTCIALVIRGYFYNDDDQKTPFCGLWHWSGFNPDEGIEPDGTEVLNSFFEYAEKQLEFGDNTILYLSELQFIGGEHPEYSDNGELNLNGTENEVNELQMACKKLKTLVYDIQVKPENIKWHNFLTENDTSMLVKVSLDECSYEVQNADSNTFSPPPISKPRL